MNKVDNLLDKACVMLRSNYKQFYRSPFCCVCGFCLDFFLIIFFLSFCKLIYLKTVVTSKIRSSTTQMKQFNCKTTPSLPLQQTWTVWRDISTTTLNHKQLKYQQQNFNVRMKGNGLTYLSVYAKVSTDFKSPCCHIKLCYCVFFMIIKSIKNKLHQI
jgi:hypothetical protein